MENGLKLKLYDAYKAKIEDRFKDTDTMGKGANEKVINESSGGIRNLQELQRRIESIKNLDGVIVNPRSLGRDKSGMDLFIVAEGESESTEETVSFSFVMRGITVDDEGAVKIDNVRSNEGIDEGVFGGMDGDVGEAAQEEAEEKREKIKEMIDDADADSIMHVNISKAINMLDKTMPAFSRMMSGISRRVIKSGTLSISFDRDTKRLNLNINPKFVLYGVVSEYASTRGKYKSLDECYKQVFSFMLAHEIMHAMRHTAGLVDSSTFGDVDENEGLGITNVALDSYINTYLGKVFRAETGHEDIPLKGMLIGDDVKFITSTVPGEGLPPGFTPFARTFKGYRSSRELYNSIVGVIRKVFKATDVECFDRGGDYKIGPMDAKGGVVIIAFRCPDMRMFGGNSGLMANFYNGVIGEVTEKAEVPERQREKPPKGPLDPPDITGEMVRSKETGKVGYVISDDGEGNIKVFYPEDQENHDPKLKKGEGEEID